MTEATREIPLSRPWIDEREEELVLEVLRSGRLSLGPWIERFESIVNAGQPAPSDIPVTWDSNHFVKGQGGSTYVPFTLVVDRSKLTKPGVALAPPAATPNAPAGQKPPRNGTAAAPPAPA